MKEYDLSLFDNKKNKTSAAVAKELLPKIKEYLSEIDNFDNDTLYKTLSEKAAEAGVKSGAFFWVMRIAITGRALLSAARPKWRRFSVKKKPLNA